jgi:hypothetical protein
MLTREVLIAALPELGRLDLLPVETLYLEDYSGEGTRLVFRSPPQRFSGAAHFWVNAVRHLEKWDDLYDKSEDPRECHPLTESEFGEFLSKYLQWRKGVLTLIPQGAFVGAWRMFGFEWDEAGALAEYRDEFIAVFWSTSA